jgi:hypothetical protein
MVRILRRALSLKQKYAIKYIVAILNPHHLTSLIPIGRFKHSNFRLQQEFERLHPYKLKEGLKRVGGFKDGGYLIPSINLEIDGLISPGIGDSFSFEFELVGLTEKVVLIDATVNKPKNLPDNMIHLQKMLAASSSQAGDYISLVDIRTKYFPTVKSLVLQMDIEGSEYEILSAMEEQELAGINLILIEFHNIGEQMLFSQGENLLKKSLDLLFVSFDLVHTHPNNAGGFFLNRFRVFPKVVETTWIRKGFTGQTLSKAELPHLLDVPNDPLIQDFPFPRFVQKKKCLSN